MFNVWFLSFLPAGGDGLVDRRFIHAVSTDRTMTIALYRELHPELFEEPGHYTVLSPIDRIDVQKKKGQ